MIKQSCTHTYTHSYTNTETHRLPKASKFAGVQFLLKQTTAADVAMQYTKPCPTLDSGQHPAVSQTSYTCMSL